MKHVNVLWPEELEAEYLRLCDRFYDTISDEDAENDDVFYRKQDAFIDANASPELKEWIAYVDRVKNESA